MWRSLLPADSAPCEVSFQRLHFLDAALWPLILIVILSLRLAPRFRDWAESASPRRILQAYIVMPLVLLANDLLQLPTEAYGHHLSVVCGGSVQRWGSWTLDWAKSELITFVITGAVIWLLYAMIRGNPRRWWLIFWLIAVPIVIFLMFVAPVLIEPMFHHFDPLQAHHPNLVAEIQKVVRHGGLDIPASRMFEMDASQKVNSVNAYVNGVGASRRVVVFDNTIERMSTPHILVIFGHEMGHYVLGHDWAKIGFTCGELLVFLIVGYYAIHWMLARWGKSWSIRGIGDWASIPCFILAYSIFSFLAEPIGNSFSRMLEHNADVYGLEVVHGILPDSPQTSAQALQSLGEINAEGPYPSPFIRIWLYDHPPTADRVRFAAAYDPWSKGQPPKYVK